MMTSKKHPTPVGLVAVDDLERIRDLQDVALGNVAHQSTWGIGQRDWIVVEDDVRVTLVRSVL